MASHEVGNFAPKHKVMKLEFRFNLSTHEVAYGLSLEVRSSCSNLEVALLASCMKLVLNWIALQTKTWSANLSSLANMTELANLGDLRNLHTWSIKLGSFVLKLFGESISHLCMNKNPYSWIGHWSFICSRWLINRSYLPSFIKQIRS